MKRQINVTSFEGRRWAAAYGGSLIEYRIAVLEENMQQFRAEMIEVRSEIGSVRADVDALREEMRNAFGDIRAMI
jgi:uncharacterized coiled-coil DUF342 family protein